MNFIMQLVSLAALLVIVIAPVVAEENANLVRVKKETPAKASVPEKPVSNEKRDEPKSCVESV